MSLLASTGPVPKIPCVLDSKLAAPEGSQCKLKKTELCRKPNKGQLVVFFFFFFSNNLQAFRSRLEHSLLETGLSQHTQFPAWPVLSQNLNIVFFPIPSFCDQKRKRKGNREGRRETGSKPRKVPCDRG